MALLPMEPQADHQESMFEDSTDFAGAEAFEAAEEPSYPAPEDQGADGFSEDTPEPIADKTESARASEPTPNLDAETESAAEPLTVLTVDDFAALEERVLRAVSLVRRERDARTAAEERTVALEARLHAQNPAIERLQQEVDTLRTEREQVRQRVER